MLIPNPEIVYKMRYLLVPFGSKLPVCWGRPLDNTQWEYLGRYNHEEGANKENKTGLPLHVAVYIAFSYVFLLPMRSRGRLRICPPR